MASLPAAIRDPYRAAYAEALHPVFLIAGGLAVAGFVATWFLQERPLRQTVADQGIGDSFASPRDASSLDELEARLSTLARRENRHRVYEHLAGVAGLDVTPAEAWLLLRFDDDDSPTLDELATRLAVPADDLRPLAAALRAHGLLEAAPASKDGQICLTAAGRVAMHEMAEARRAELERFLDDWQPTQHREVQQLLERFAQSLRSRPPAGEPAPA